MPLASPGRGAEPTTQTAPAAVQQAGAPSKASGGGFAGYPHNLVCTHCDVQAHDCAAFCGCFLTRWIKWHEWGQQR